MDSSVRPGSTNNEMAVDGRGMQFSAGYRRQQAEQFLVEGTDYCLPLDQRIEDSIQSAGLQQASVSTPIPAHNKGYILLQKMGWAGPGKGLGKNSDGMNNPIDLNALDAGMRLGLGKMQQDAAFTAAENISRKQLEAEIQMEEDEERREKRLGRVEQQSRIQQEVKQILQTFYCEVCDKQYKYAAELEEHMSSYSHHHTKRLREMRKMEQDRTREQRERKALKSSQKEMARLNRQIAAAAGKPPAAAAAPPPPLPPNDPPAVDTALLPSHEQQSGGWAPPPLPPDAGGWASSAPPAHAAGGWARQENSWQAAQPGRSGADVGASAPSGGTSRLPDERYRATPQSAAAPDDAARLDSRGLRAADPASQSCAKASRWDVRSQSAAPDARWSAEEQGTSFTPGFAAVRQAVTPQPPLPEGQPPLPPSDMPAPQPPLPPGAPPSLSPPTLSFGFGGRGHAAAAAGRGAAAPRSFGLTSSVKRGVVPASKPKLGGMFGDDEGE